MDLDSAVRWAGQAAVPGTAANKTLIAGLHRVLDVSGAISITNPVSSARDGTTPDLTRVLLCNVQNQDGMLRFCLKLYPSSLDGASALKRHALFLSQLKGIVPVPEVVHVLLEPDLFGFPALLTTASGQPLDHELQRLSDASIKAIMVEIAEAIAALHNVNSSNLPVDSVYDPQLLLDQWQEDSEWYITNADGAGKAAGLVRKGCISAGKHIWGA